MTTKKDLIISKYEELKSKLQLYVNKDMFPSLNDFDIVDVVSLIKLYFPIDSDYNETIKGLMKENEIEVNYNDSIIISSLIINFVDFLNNI
jgi:hypothetical protein